jgi:CP family cyanate transporter-like MFS transporter
MSPPESPVLSRRESSSGRPSARPVTGVTLVLAGMLLVAVNLRLSIVSLGALLEEVRTGLGLSGTVAGLVTTMPALAFAAFGLLTPGLVRRFGAPRVLVGAMVVLAAGQLARVVTDSTAVFVGTSALALAGIAVGNVLLPSLVREYFPGRTGAVTGLYMMCLTGGAALAAAVTVPIADAAGSWRVGLGVWALAALLAVPPWLPAALRRIRPARRAGGSPTGRGGRIRPARSPLAWAIAGYFGTQALGAYVLMGWLPQIFRDAGYPAPHAGLLTAAMTALGVPIALFMPALTGRPRALPTLMIAMSAALLLGYLGLALAPYAGAWAWILLIALGQGGFPFVLAMIGLRARTAEGTVALSAFSQSGGYLIAALGPFLIGFLYDASGGWRVPIGFLIGTVLVQTLCGLAVVRPRYVEDDD